MIHEKLYSHLRHSDKLKLYSINPKAKTESREKKKQKKGQFFKNSKIL